MITTPIHIEQVNGKPLRFFASPVTYEPEFPWHSADDLVSCMGLRRAIRREFQRRLKSDWKADVRTIATSSGITTICPHYMAQGMIDAMVEVGQCPKGLYMLYARGNMAAMKVMTSGMPPEEGVDW